MKPLPCMAVEVAVESGVLATVLTGLSLADVTAGEGVVVGGTVGAIVVLVGATVNWYLRIRKDRTDAGKERMETDQEAEDRQAARERKIRKDTFDEWKRTVDDLRQDRDMDRKEMHDLRNEVNAEKLAHAVTSARLDVCEKARVELFRRVEALEAGREGGQ